MTAINKIPAIVCVKSFVNRLTWLLCTLKITYSKKAIISKARILYMRSVIISTPIQFYTVHLPLFPIRSLGFVCLFCHIKIWNEAFAN